MSDQKREYIEYYYFWLNQYKYRLIRKREENGSNERKYQSLMGDGYDMCDYCEFSEEMNKECFSVSDNKNKLRDRIKYLKDRASSLEYCSMSAFEEFLGWKKDVYNLMNNYTDGCSLIENVINGEDIYGEDVRFPQDFGVNIIGGDDVEIDENGNIKSNIILNVNFDIPIEIIVEQIRKIKSINLKKGKTIKKLKEDFCEYSTSIDVEYAIIKNLSPDEFNHKNTNSRLVGVAIWDIIHPSKDIINMMKYLGEESPQTVKGAIESLNERHPDYLEKLGYGNSEVSVFRRLYNRTCECIEKCEVLPMK